MIDILPTPTDWNEVRLGVIGTGQISNIILPMIADKGVRIVGLADVNVSSAEELAAKLSPAPQVYATAEKLLDNPEIEAVYIATPPKTHRPIMRAALAAGKAVICEKPFMSNQAEAELAAADTAEYPNIPVSCCSSRFRFTPTTQAAGRLIQAGRLGKLQRVRLITSDSPPKSIDQLPGWKRDAASAGGGLVADWGVYEIEWLRGLLGENFDPTEVTATLNFWKREGSDIESGYDVIIHCASGLDVFISRQPEVGPKKSRVEIRGDAGGLDLPFCPGSAEAPAQRAQLHLLDEDGKSTVTSSESEPATDWPTVLGGPILNLGQAVRGIAPIAASPETQILVHAVIDSILKSGRSGKPVSINLS